ALGAARVLQVAPVSSAHVVALPGAPTTLSSSAGSATQARRPARWIALAGGAAVTVGAVLGIAMWRSGAARPGEAPGTPPGAAGAVGAGAGAAGRAAPVGPAGGPAPRAPPARRGDRARRRRRGDGRRSARDCDVAQRRGSPGGGARDSTGRRGGRARRTDGG